jgi:hypothetical protein
VASTASVCNPSNTISNINFGATFGIGGGGRGGGLGGGGGRGGEGGGGGGDDGIEVKKIDVAGGVTWPSNVRLN